MPVCPVWGQASAWMWEAHTDGMSQPHRRRTRRTAACTSPAASPSPLAVRVVEMSAARSTADWSPIGDGEDEQA